MAKNNAADPLQRGSVVLRRSQWDRLKADAVAQERDVSPQLRYELKRLWAADLQVVPDLPPGADLKPGGLNFVGPGGAKAAPTPRHEPVAPAGKTAVSGRKSRNEGDPAPAAARREQMPQQPAAPAVRAPRQPAPAPAAKPVIGRADAPRPAPATPRGRRGSAAPPEKPVIQPLKEIRAGVGKGLQTFVNRGAGAERVDREPRE